MSRSRVVLVVLFCAALLTPVGTAQAGSSVLCTGYASCEGKGYSHAGYASHKGTSYWRMYTGTNCTNYVAYRLVTTNGMPNVRPKSGVGNARDWGTAMSSITDKTPTVGSVAWWGKTGNHVAYVEKVVSSSEIIVSESNWSGAFDWRRITKSGSGWPDGFIHFADRVLKNTSKPTLRSTPQVGVALSPSVGKWTVMGSGNKYAYQWTADGKPISGATQKAYTPTPDLAGKDLALRVTASRSGYASGTATSAKSEVEPGSIDSGDPVITGTGRVDDILTAEPGSWSPVPSSYDYQWLVAGKAVSGATSATFVPRPVDVGRDVTVRVTGSLTGYTSAAATSAAREVSPGVVTATTRPSVAGKPVVGGRLTAQPGTWSAPGLEYGFQWYVDGVAVAGATGSTYTAVAADRGKAVHVRVTARGPGYTTASATSAVTAPVAGGTVPAAQPTITGTPQLGSVLTVDPGPQDVPGAKATYQWLRDGKVKSGATKQRRKVIASDLGKRLSVRVTWTAPGYTSRTLTTGTVGPAKARSALRVTAKPGRGKVTFTVSLPVAGLPNPGAKLTVSRKGGGTKSFTISKGKGSYTLTKQKAGKQTYTISYAGTSTIAAATTTLTSKIT